MSWLERLHIIVNSIMLYKAVLYRTHTAGDRERTNIEMYKDRPHMHDLLRSSSHLGTETIERATGTLQRIHDIQSRNSFAAGWSVTP